MDIVSDIARILVTSLVSIGLLFGLCKLIGQRQIHQMSMFDYINSITIGSIAAELATDLERWWEPLTAALVYGLAVVTINIVTCHSMVLRRFFNGKPLVLYEEGRLYKGNLRKARMDSNEFLTQCRIAGYFDLTELEAAVLETNGQISFMPLADRRPATPQDLGLELPPESLAVNLILDGKILWENLKYSGHDETWLNKQLHQQGISHARDVFLATCDKQGHFAAFPMRDKVVQHDIFE